MPRTSSTTPNKAILEAALQGLEAQREKLEEQISHVRGMLGTRAARPTKIAKSASRSASTGESNGRPKRVLSAEARKRIAAAQKKRWAAYRKAS